MTTVRWVAGIGCVVASLGVLALLPGRANGPWVQGRRTSTWLLGLGGRDLEGDNQAIDVLREAGTNSLPLMIEMLGARDSTLKVWAEAVVGNTSTARLIFTRPDWRDPEGCALFRTAPPEPSLEPDHAPGV